MRLHRLEVSGFGPYSGHEVVDFDALGADGLFLLHGDTGAGKTALLDAVAFALYGKVPGARKEAKRFRCDTAASDTPTWVSLELTVQGHRLRVHRTPEYQRPKRSGSGYTPQKAKASLTWVSGPPEDLPSEGATRIDEVGRTVQRLLGMNAEQFFQVVMLPQGEFARFLHADTGDRAELLEKLFGTQRLTRVAEWFSDHRKQRRQRLSEQRAHVDQLLARAIQVAGVEPEDGADRASWLEDLEKRLTRESEEADAEQERLRRARDEAERVLAARRDLADKVRRVRLARAELSELDEHRAEHEAWRAEQDAATRAMPVLTAHRAARRATEEYERAAEEVTVASARCVGVDTEGDTDELRAASSRLHEQAGALAQLVTESEQQDDDRRRLSELADRIEADRSSDAELAEQQDGLPARIEATRRELDEAKHAAARLDAASGRVDELAALVEDARRLPDAREELATAETRARAAVDEHQSAREHLQNLRERRLAGMAAELATTLDDGSPCPVCGSAEHPDPRRAVDEPVGAEDEERARAEEQAAQARREQAHTEVTRARQAHDRLRERLGEHTESGLTSELAEATSRRDALRERGERERSLSDRLAELESDSERLTTRRGELATRVAAARSEHANLAGTVEERHSRLEQGRGEFDGVAHRREHLLDTAARVDRLVTARIARDDARRRSDEQWAALAETAAEAGFDGVDAALAAERDERRRAELAESLAEVERRETAARAALASEELAGVDADAEVGLDEAVEAATTAREAAEQAAATARGAEQRRRDVAELAERLRRAWAELGPEQAAFAELDALTDVVNGGGQNARKMSLRSYVLAARLEEVAAAATHRLRRMSEGRYSFVHSDAAGPHGARGGLGLDVLDDYSGQTRPTKTLSGGESFLASLSLALGLADVVAAETGGVLLDTLFIDEGFGTLDADTLDLVMNTLDDLRAGGRVVGLVSHVEEMRQRIGVRLRVSKSRAGSTLTLES